MPPTEQDPTVVWLVTAAELALSRVHGSQRRDKVCRFMSGWFAQQSQAESETLEFEGRQTPILPPPPDDEIPVTEGSYPPSEDDE